MFLKGSNWIGLLLLAAIFQVFAAADEDDVGPMPHPKGPFFSSKPLLYYGEMLESEPTGALPTQQNYPTMNRPPQPVYRGPAPMNRYPYYNAPAPYGYNGNRMPFQQSPQVWGGQQQPYFPGYPQFPQNGRR